MTKSVFDIALVGVGPMAALHAAAIAQVPGLRLVSCASRQIEKAQAFAGTNGIPQGRLLADVMAAPEADALWVVAPADVMGPLALDLAATGLPLFLEKPVGLDAAETADIAARISVPSMVGLNRRFYEVLHHARAAIDAAGGLRAIEIHMPEDLTRVPPNKHVARTLEQWQFANSVHLLDLFRFLGGEVEQVETMNDLRSVNDRGYNALIRFRSGAVGHYNGQWYAPGGWRVALYGDGVMVELKPIEKATIYRRGADPQVIEASGADARLKPGLFGQAAAFASLLAGRPDKDAADLAEYARSVTLVERLTSAP